MNCRESLDMLQRRLDGENLSSSLALDQHLAGCPSCRHKHAGANLILEGLKVLPRIPELPAQFADRLVDSILDDRRKRRARLGRRAWVAVGLAAAILIIVFAGQAWLPRHKQDGGANVADHKKPMENPVPSPVPPVKKAQPEAVPPLAQTVAEARSDVLVLASRVAKEQTRLLAALAPNEIPTFPMEARLPMEEPLDPAAESLRQAGQGVSEGLDTVSRNARRAVSFFMKELPVLD